MSINSVDHRPKNNILFARVLCALPHVQNTRTQNIIFRGEAAATPGK